MLTMILALVLLAAGLLLTAGGVWLITLGGSWYYAIAGVGVLLTSIFMLTSSMGAVWIYLATYLFTLGWAYWEVGVDWWAQVPRLVGPTLILILVLFTVPVLRRRQFVEDVGARDPVPARPENARTTDDAHAPVAARGPVPAEDPIVEENARRTSDPAAPYSGRRRPVKGAHG